MTTDAHFAPHAQANYIRLDLFPAAVNGPELTPERNVRAIITDSHYYFLVDAPGGFASARSGALYSFEGDNRSQYTVIDADTEDTYVFARSSGCGCGSRLRGIRPFPGVPLQAALNTVL